ncbi:MAG: hypothetical protein H7Z17_19895 [Fuerstia sp.]|nr:hypothetical protein [Fuerstiella sp.]
MRDSAFHLPPAAILMMVIFSGCASSTSLIRDPSILVKDPLSIVGHPRIERNVARVVALWEPTTGKGLDDQNARGFAGQILFFGSGCETGARVHGTVNIYEYDNYDANSDEEPVLLHTFAFDPDAWEVHRGVGTFGHSYSVFIPYMKHHKDQVHCGLKVEFIMEDGRRISTGTTEVLLQGKRGRSEVSESTRGFVRQRQIGSNTEAMSSQAPSGETSSEPRTLNTLSIPLPKR